MLIATLEASAAGQLAKCVITQGGRKREAIGAAAGATRPSIGETFEQRVASTKHAETLSRSYGV